MRRIPLFIFLSVFFVSACTPKFVIPGDAIGGANISAKTFTSFDGTELPLKIWLPDEPLRAIFIGLHGYNDYSNFIMDAVGLLNKRGIGVYSYDQRGFGQAPHKGMWHGPEALCRDLKTIVLLVKELHPDIPLYLLGDSMGGAVILVTYSKHAPLPVDGAILVAPAVWSRSTMPFYQRWALWLGAHLMPWARVSVKSLDITASDNTEMLKNLGRDPLVIKESRIDAIYGLADLMDAAYESAPLFNENVLFLYGKKDEIIPPKPMSDVFRKRLNNHYSKPQRLLVYENGYHMLLRDLQADVVWRDILFWLGNPQGNFPSVQAGTAIEVASEKQIKIWGFPK